jgi:uncharacterized protein (DUF58 family)
VSPASPPLRLFGRRFTPAVWATPTREGRWLVGLLLAVVLAAMNTGNNLLYVLLAGLCALLVLSSALAEWNLRGLTVERRLPAELYAGHGAHGAYRLRSERRAGIARLVHVQDLDEEGVVVGGGLLMSLPPGAESEVAATWTAPQRGPFALRRLRLTSRYPFGLMERWREVSLPAELLAYPQPGPEAAARRSAASGQAEVDRRRRGGQGELIGLRAYQPGDPPRDIHWPTSARSDAVMVVTRSAEVADQVLIEIPDAPAPRWEAELSAATGALLHHFRCGQAVGMRLLGESHPIRPGDAWRRHLLAALARAPRRGEPA